MRQDAVLPAPKAVGSACHCLVLLNHIRHDKDVVSTSSKQVEAALNLKQERKCIIGCLPSAPSTVGKTGLTWHSALGSSPRFAAQGPQCATFIRVQRTDTVEVLKWPSYELIMHLVFL